MDLGSLLETAVVGAAACMFVAHWWLQPERRARRLLRQTRARRIADMRPGERARVTGRVSRDGAALRSPLSHRACVAYRFAIETFSRGDDDWQTAVSRSSTEPFVIGDASGEALVEGPFLIVLGATVQGGTDGPAPPGLRDLIASEAIPTLDERGRPIQIRCGEALLAPGDRATVVGRAGVRVDPTGARAGPRAPPLRWALQGSGDDPVVVGRAPDGPGRFG